MVDILLAVYNGEKYLEEQLSSIENQTYKDWRLIIRDDCSKDKSMLIAEKFSRKFKPGKVVIYKNNIPSGSAKNNFLRLLKDSDAEYVMFSDQDDVWLENKISLTLKAMRRSEQEAGEGCPILVHSDLFVTDEKLRIVSNSFFKYQKIPKKVDIKRLLLQNSVTGCTVMINKMLKEYLEKVDCPEKIVMHDYFAALISEVFGKIVFINRPLIKYRQHGDNSVGAADASSFSYLKARFIAGKEQFRQRMKATMIQAGYFAELYKIQLKNNSRNKMLTNLLINYNNLLKVDKKTKVKFYIENNVFKYGIIRKIMQLVWS